ncbi:hypothetical protein HBI60_257590, partial [Parastagonospora nodorum]
KREVNGNSVQIIYSQLNSTVHSINEPHPQKHSDYFWMVYYGPYGTAVDPCNYVPFTLSRAYNAPEVEGTDITNPPFPPKARWAGPLPPFADDECRIEGSGDRPPTLECGQPSNVIMDFQEDVQYEDPVIVCSETKVKYHRGWTVEY